MIKGTIVVTTEDLYCIDKGTIGYCCDCYALDGREGFMIIFDNGVFDGFSAIESERFLKELTIYHSDYQFKNAMKIYDDYRSNVFNKMFECGRNLLKE